MKTTVTGLAVALTMACSSSWAHAFDFTLHDFYTTQDSLDVINCFDPSGKYLDSMTLSGTELRGLAFGPDGLLYTVAETLQGQAVLAVDQTGHIRQTYLFNQGYIGGATYTGKIAFDNNGHFYVGTEDGLLRFNTGNPNSATMFFNTDGVQAFNVLGANDLKILQNGDIIVAGEYSVVEISSSGTFMRTILDNVDIRGIEYNAATDQLFVTALGDGNDTYRLLSYDFTTGAEENEVHFTYGNDMILADNGSLIVASDTQNPGIFTQNLVQTGAFTNYGTFVTQLTASSFVPEPGLSLWLSTGVAAGAGIFLRRRKLKGCK